MDFGDLLSPSSQPSIGEGCYGFCLGFGFVNRPFSTAEDITHRVPFEEVGKKAERKMSWEEVIGGVRHGELYIIYIYTPYTKEILCRLQTSRITSLHLTLKTTGN